MLKRLVIHCTDTREGKEVSSSDIRLWHTSPPPRGNGWKQVGYTDMFHLDGTIERLVANNEDAKVDPWEITNGAKGYNATSRHVVYVGGKSTAKQQKDTRTEAQKESMERYVKDFHLRFPTAEICGHRDLDNKKSCPCFDVKEWLKEIGL